MNYELFLAKLGGILQQIQKEYFVTGGFALSIWGAPRSTLDVDVVIALKESDISIFVKAIRTLGEQVYVDEQMIIQEVHRQGEFNIIDPSGLKVDFFVMKDDAFSKMQNQRKRVTDIADQKVFFISPEDLILSKLRWAKTSRSERQIRDVESVCTGMKDELDWNYLREWARKIDVNDLLIPFLPKG